MKFFLLAVLMLALPAQAKEILLTTANTVSIRSQIDFSSVTKAQLELATLVKDRGRSPYPIYLVLDSPGGSIAAGENFIEFAKQFQNVHTVSIFAASMASAIVQSMPGQRLVIGSGALMFHRAAGRFQGQFEVGEVESQLELWKHIVRGMEMRNAARIGISLQDYKAKVVNEWWAYGSQAVEQKVADEVVTVRCSDQLIAAKEVQKQQSFFGSFSTVLSKCPLIRGPIEGDNNED